MINKRQLEKFMERHNLTKEILAEVADVSLVDLDEYVEGTLQNKKLRKRIARTIYVIERNNICIPVIDGYYRLLSDVFPETFNVDQLRKSHIESFKTIFNQFYEDEFGE